MKSYIPKCPYCQEIWIHKSSKDGRYYLKCDCGYVTDNQKPQNSEEECIAEWKKVSGIFRRKRRKKNDSN